MQKGLIRWTSIAMIGGLAIAVLGGALWVLAAANEVGHQGFVIMLAAGLILAAAAFAIRVLASLERR